MAETSLKLLQFNTLAKHLAETIQFPYAIDVEKEKSVDRGDAYESWERYGITEKHWLYKELCKGGTPLDYLLGQAESGTFAVEQSGGKYIYSWSERFPQLVAQIMDHDPDLIFLQELEAATVPDFAKALGAQIQMLEMSSSEATSIAEGSDVHKYEGVYAPRADRAMSDGVAILWNKEKLRAIPGKGCQVLRYKDAQKLALLQPLQVSGKDSSFLAVTTHLHWNPAASLQEAEVAELLEELRSRERPLPVVIGGDLNCGVQNKAYAMLPDAGFEDVDSRLPAGSCKRYTMHVPRAPVPKLTDARRWDQPSITELHPVVSDYVLTRDLSVSDVRVLNTGLQGGPEGFVPSATNGLPNRNWSASDHFPIAYEIRARW